MATSRDAKSDTIKVIPSGLSILPSIPDRKKSGIKAIMIINVACTIEERISRDAL